MAETPAAGGLSPRQRVLIGGAVVTVIVLGLALFALFSRLTAPPAANPLDRAGEVRVIDPPRPVSDFTLTDQTGAPFSLSDLRGRAVLLFFGYTHCPDVCPLTLLEFRRVHDLLGTQAGDVAFVFVSVDGARDTPEALASTFALRGVDDFAIGLTGDEAALRRIGADYGLYFERQADTGSQADYLVDHTANSFLVDREGRLTTIFTFGTEPEQIAARIRDLWAAS
ncbi:MAG: SCO family protein [Anaerolineae bacterium]|nr:SCO family protein [Anaerolineae bacterium]